LDSDINSSTNISELCTQVIEILWLICNPLSFPFPLVLVSVLFCRGPVFQSSHSLVSHLSRQLGIARLRSVPECVSKREVKNKYVCTMRGKRKESMNHESEEQNKYLFGKCMCWWRGERSLRRLGGVKHQQTGG
jgi:hypothetical protein